MKTAVLISGLLILLVANIVMVYFAPYGLREGFRPANMQGFKSRENFQNVNAGNSNNAANAPAPNAPAPNEPAANNSAANSPANNAATVNGAATGGANMNANSGNSDMNATEGFASYFLENAGGSKETYQAIGPYDGVKLSTGNNVSGWRYTAPNEPLNGAEFQPGPDSLFMFKNNQCKPECCGASFSCGGGCVCTTPQQRQYIAARGGNRTQPEDSA
jgi:hypothetical protein